LQSNCIAKQLHCKAIALQCLAIALQCLTQSHRFRRPGDPWSSGGASQSKPPKEVAGQGALCASLAIPGSSDKEGLVLS
jgi:hypothetical protein